MILANDRLVELNVKISNQDGTNYVRTYQELKTLIENTDTLKVDQTLKPLVLILNQLDLSMIPVQGIVDCKHFLTLALD